ncbi:MAG: hypothetical protein L6Q98_12530 [Anaerolineae bacterium]|nr:hypothetical protein [Anaerolineae bacterium]NUQ04597.1 hypothetical protein [Anaerolineae bacterium]
MRRLTLLLLILCLTATGILAQSEDATETLVTPGGMRFSFPALYDASIVSHDEFTLASFASGSGVIITVTSGESARAILGSAPNLDQALTDHLASLFAQYDPARRESIALFNGFGIFQPAQTLGGRSFFVAFETGEGADRRLVLIHALSPTARQHDIDALKEPLVRMLESIAFDVEPPQLPEEIALPTLELPAEALTPAEMPEGVIVFNTDIQMTLPDGWSFVSPGSDIYDTALLQSGDPAPDVQVMIYTSDPSKFLQIAGWREQILRLARTQIAGVDAAQPVFPPDSVIIEGATTQRGTRVELLENTTYGVQLYFINLNDRAGAAILAAISTQDPNRRADITADLQRMARSALRFVREEPAAS